MTISSLHEVVHDNLEEPYLRSLIDSCFDVLWTADIKPGGVGADVILLSDLGFRIGYKPGEIPRRISSDQLATLMHPNDIAAFKDAIVTCVKTGKFSIEVRNVGPEGQITWWNLRGVPIGFEGDHPRWWVGAGNEVTAQKVSEAKFENTLAELTQIKEQLEIENRFLRGEFGRETEFHEIVGRTAPLKAALELVRRVSPTSTLVLVTGETGTGKELIARAIHMNSPRRDRPLVTVNCATLPATLIESDLFGHERGAFTGAVSRQIGRFEFAHKSTLFLDEVGELPLELQAKLLRVIETGQFNRVGSMETRQVDVRIVAATNRNLKQEVIAGRFRSDLYYRLGVFPIHLPPLRERKGDIPLLVAYLVDRKCTTLGKVVRHIPSSIIDMLQEHDWPGNVRELENIIERSIILSDGPVLRLFDGLIPSGKAPRELIDIGAMHAGRLEDVEREFILKTCIECGWKIKGPKGAAEKLGLNPSTLYFRMKKLRISKPG